MEIHDNLCAIYWKEQAARMEGKLEGKIEGKLEGKIEGKLEGKLESEIDITRKIILKLKSLGNTYEYILNFLLDIVDLDEDLIKKEINKYYR